MTTKINGTNTAASPAITGADTDTGLSFGTDTVNINTGGTTRVTVDSAGSVGIGTSTPTSSFSNADDLVVGDGSGNRGMTILAGTSGISGIEFSDGTGSDATKTAGGIRYYHSSDYMRFNTGGGTERMRLLSSGSLCIGVDTTNNSEKMRIDSTGSTGTVFLRHADTNNVSIMEMRHTRVQSSNSASYIKFLDSSGTVRGSIKASTSGTTYFTTSDYRLKENITAISDGITRLKTLKPSKFNFIGDSKIVDGFLAHEVTAVPEAITGTKDAVETTYYMGGDTIPDGKAVGDVKDPVSPVYQGIDHSKLVPLLTAALQEAVAKIEVLETKVAALEAA